MKSTGFWIRRFMVVAGAVFVILAAVGLLKGHMLAEAWLEALGWALASATVFVAARYRSARRGEACALCRDTVED